MYIIDLSCGWEFVRSRASRRWLAGSSDLNGLVVDLPHSWNETDVFQAGVEYYRGEGSYRKNFVIRHSAEDKNRWAWYLEADGFYGTGTLWINGRRVSRVDGQYLGFRLNVGDALNFDCENVIGIALDNRPHRYVLPGINMPDFLLYGGLSGRMRLVCLPALHIRRDSVRVICEDVLSAKPSVRTNFTISNTSLKVRRGKFVVELCDMSGDVLVQSDPISLDIPSQSSVDAPEVMIEASAVRLWSPKSPNLYKVICRVLGDDNSDQAEDCVALTIGFREAVFEPKQGFFLNGERLTLVGCNRHESMPGFGNALLDGMHRRDAEILKDMGCNFVRLSHYPEHPCFLNACDELGILVYAEIATWKSVRSGRWLKAACRQMRDMVLRDRNHPSIIVWGMGNESRSRDAYLALRDVVRKLDPGRPVTYAENHFYRAVRERTLLIPDIWSTNYEFEAIEEGCESSGLKNVVVSECSNYPLALRGSFNDELAQVALIEKDLKTIGNSPHVAGFLLWCLTDYSTLRKNRYKRYSGILDAWRLPKMSSSLLTALYCNKPYIKGFCDWMAAQKGNQADVHVFTNCENVVLKTASGKRIEMGSGSHLVAQIDAHAGALVISGFFKGETVENKINLFGPPDHIAIAPVLISAETDLRTVVELELSVVDSDRRIVRTWDAPLVLTVKGNACIRSFTPTGAVMMGNGIGRGFVEVKRRDEFIKVNAVSNAGIAGMAEFKAENSGRR
ncbi:MAG: hypothetical protein JXN60_09415 [Lentisphaerae bacterium]|nr:hypothetical protein [Lentisphaerota bacterium]